MVLIELDAAIDAMMRLQAEDIEAYGASIPEGFDGDRAVMALKALPPAQPGWIPCTPETMPEKTDTYLVQVGINKNGEGMHTEVRTAVWNVIWQKWYVHTTHCFVGDIIKWMPIPWEGGQDE